MAYSKSRETSQWRPLFHHKLFVMGCIQQWLGCLPFFVPIVRISPTQGETYKGNRGNEFIIVSHNVRGITAFEVPGVFVRPATKTAIRMQISMAQLSPADFLICYPSKHQDRHRHRIKPRLGKQINLSVSRRMLLKKLLYCLWKAGLWISASLLYTIARASRYPKTDCFTNITDLENPREEQR